MPKLVEYQYVYKKSVGFTLQQKEAFKVLKDHNVNVNQFIRSAIDEKLKRDWKTIKQNKINTNKYPF